MNEFINFSLKHWELSLLFFGILIALLVLESKRANDKANIGPEFLISLINRKNPVIIDIRAKDKFSAGHIIGSKNFLQNEIYRENKKIQKYTKKPIVIVCADGIASTKIAHKLKSSGFEEAYSLKGGIAAWSKEGFPLTVK